MRLLLITAQLLISTAQSAQSFPACRWGPADTKSWTTVHTKGLSFSLPAIFKPDRKKRTDSGEYAWISGTAELFTAYGILDEAKMTAAADGKSVCEADLDGERAIITAGADKGNFWALLWFPGVHPWVKEGSSTRELKDSSLLFSARGNTAAQQRQFLAAFKTIRFATKKFVVYSDQAPGSAPH